MQNVTPWVQVRYSMFFSMPVCRYPMDGRTSATVSPSRVRTRRSTPWVDGCCGPMLMTSRSPAWKSLASLAAATISSQSSPETV